MEGIERYWNMALLTARTYQWTPRSLGGVILGGVLLLVGLLGIKILLGISFSLLALLLG